jgi:ethanolamine ammonia-lyase small subunit
MSPCELREQPPVPIEPNPWTALRQFTAARIALGRVGASLPTQEVLRFGVAHALARDAVHTALDVASLTAALVAAGRTALTVTSCAPDRASYLLRPDLGRTLHKDAAQTLRGVTAPAEIAFVIADGLSAVAAQRHSVPLLAEILPLLAPSWQLAPIVIATLARVALGDEIGACLGARLVVMLIGERPGLSAPDSLGAYLTFQPRRGRTDAERNCVSNIRPAGLGYQDAARKISWLIAESLRLRLTGVELKDDSEQVLLPR